MGKIVRVKPGSLTNRNRLGFGSLGEQSPFAARRRVENLSGFLLFGLDRQLRRHLHDQGPIEMRNDAKPHRKRVEAYSGL